MANSKRKCKFCKVYSTEWVTLPIGTFCSKQHAIDFAYQPKVLEAGRDKRHAHKKKELRESSKGWWVKVTQDDFNKMIRERDRFRPCITCDRENAEVEQEEGWKVGGAWDCGHYLSVGSHPEHRFNPDNAHKQCKSCNGGSGNYTRKNHEVSAAYELAIVKRIGEERAAALRVKIDQQHYTIDDLKELRALFKAKLKEYEKQNEIL